MPRTEYRWLIVKCDRSTRLAKRLPILHDDEVAVRVVITFPDGWGRRLPVDLSVTVPDLLPATSVAT